MSVLPCLPPENGSGLPSMKRKGKITGQVRSLIETILDPAVDLVQTRWQLRQSWQTRLILLAHTGNRIKWCDNQCIVLRISNHWNYYLPNLKCWDPILYAVYSRNRVFPLLSPRCLHPPPLPPPLLSTPPPPPRVLTILPTVCYYIAILLVYLRCTTKNGLFVFQGVVGMSSIVLRIMHTLYPRSQLLRCKRHGEKLTISPRDWVLLYSP